MCKRRASGRVVYKFFALCKYNRKTILKCIILYTIHFQYNSIDRKSNLDLYRYRVINHRNVFYLLRQLVSQLNYKVYARTGKIAIDTTVEFKFNTSVTR